MVDVGWGNGLGCAAGRSHRGGRCCYMMVVLFLPFMEMKTNIFWNVIWVEVAGRLRVFLEIAICGKGKEMVVRWFFGLSRWNSVVVADAVSGRCWLRL